TMATNDPEELLAFCRALDGRVVYKPLAGGALARRLAKEDLGAERLRLLGASPVLFQEEVPGRNIRAYVVDGEVIASYEIVSDELDYRGSESAVLPEDLQDEEVAACLRASEACGMIFTGIDIRRRPDGSFAVLECNPSPMFAAIEARQGTNTISDALAAALTKPN
ncbi:MAG TPA: ATP-dependent carboxylate-amine ligase, partial [Actinomycetota bacterium]|nr:ATP-dependent carboxylate-amine ligase [Actinomycetota bacterium]